MSENVVIAIVLASLFVVDWKTRKLALRIGAVAACLVIWWYSLPNYTIAVRRVTAASQAKVSGDLAEEPEAQFFKGASSMREALEAQQRDTLPLRVFAITGLVWLALSPRLRRATPGRERMPNA